MKTIKLLRIEMQNFKGCKHQISEFSENHCSIRGRNGSGKSRHFDAFYWCLFGKDSQDRKDYELKSRDTEGNQLQKVDTSVEIKMRINDEEMTFKRSFVEDWVKPRGQKEQILKKHHTECNINEVPMSVGDYNKRIAEIIDDSIMKMLTNPLYFAGMDWKKQREMLFNIAGVVTDEQIAGTDDRFQALLELISGKKLEEYRITIASRKSKAKKELAEIQPKIDQTYTLMPQEQDWKLIRNQLTECEESMKNLDNQINDGDVQMAQLLADNAKIRARINELQANKQEKIQQAETKLKESYYNERQTYYQMQDRVRGIEQDIKEKNNSIAWEQKRIPKLQAEKEKLQADITELRQKWFAINEETMPESSLVCSCCGQTLPEDKVTEIRAKFEANKKETLSNMTRKGQNMNEEMGAMEKEIEMINKQCDKVGLEVSKLEEQLEKAKIELSKLNYQQPAPLREHEIDGVSAINAEIERLAQSIKEPQKNIAATTARDEKKRLMEHRDALVKMLEDQNIIKSMKEEIAKLEERGKFLSGEIAETEKLEDTITDFTRAKIRECESRVNGLFDMVKWKLFDYTLDGGEFEVCIPMVNGVPFPTANKAGQIQAGLEIIKVLQGFYNIQPAIFIDNRESVQHIPDMNDTQIINLIVEDCELTINNL